MIFTYTPPKPTALREAITSAYRMDENDCVNALIKQATFAPEMQKQILARANDLVIKTREQYKLQGHINKFLHQYDLSSEEGIALMCLAEALLRIPDSQTVDRLISDKISTVDWQQHLSSDESLFMNATTWSLLITGKVFSPASNYKKSLGTTLKKLLSKSGSTVIRPLILQGMKTLGKQFVLGRTIDEAQNRAQLNEAKGYRYSYDMLGEAARTQQDADHYFDAYLKAIHAIGNASKQKDPITGPGISIKLSALHPRYEFAKHERVMTELVPRLLKLAEHAKQYNMGLTVDAEEADRLELSLDVIEAVFSNPLLEKWEGFGLAVQSYQKRAPFVIDWLADLSKRYQRKLMIRLIKGAYWDSEIKISQLLGLSGYPVFTRKHSTDISFLACAKKLLAQPEYFYPQFGTHNAYSVAAILEIAGNRRDFEFQCLHGMGAPLYDNLVGTDAENISCRIYAPVGSHKDLLGYLVRRLLENGANTSFINLMADETTPIEKIITDPIARIANLQNKPHPSIPLPKDIFGDERENSTGFDFSNSLALTKLQAEMLSVAKNTWQSSPIIHGKAISASAAIPIFSPSQLEKVVGFVVHATSDDVDKALNHAVLATTKWANTSVENRASCLERAAELLEKNTPALLTLLCEEAGKHLNDGISEIREAVDFCRYYAACARSDLRPQTLKGPTGELNQLSLHPRGIIVCISPWNFPLAIFMGQITAALVAGNAVIAKPAEQTPLIAAYTVRLLHEAGIPDDALQLLPGAGEVVGAALVADLRISGVMFTGSTETAKLINQTLANRKGPIIPFIAETGGQNAMIVDSSALAEQVVADVISSAFNSAGQRCSALRVLFVQNEMAPRLLEMLKGAMAELTIGHPALLATDVGPVIDKDALNMLQQHFATMSKRAKLIYQVPMPQNISQGHFFAPCAFELQELSLEREVFGPFLHVIRYAGNQLDKVLYQIRQTGYGLTLGVHSRVDATIQYIKEAMSVGNVYVNRNMIGAVVGVQPFGGEGLSGTGPKAGGPHYLARLCVERAISINTTAAGGNTSLVSLIEGEE